MLDGGIIQRLLEEKWKTFAQNQFLKRLLILSTHLLCLSVSVYLRPAHDGDDDDEAAASDGAGDAPATAALKELAGGGEAGGDYNAQTVARYCAELATIAGVLSYVVFQQGDEIKNQGLSAFLKQLVRERREVFSIYLSLSLFLYPSLFLCAVTCARQGHLPVLQSANPRLHSLSSYWRYGHGGGHSHLCCARQLVPAHVLCRVSNS